MARLEESQYLIYATSSKRSTIASLLFNGNDKLTLLNEVQVGRHPSWITFGEKGRGAYVLGDTISYYDLNATEVPQAVKETSKPISGQNEYVSGCIVRGLLFIANYLGGSVTVRRVSKGDSSPAIEPPLHTFDYSRDGTGPVTSRQDKSYAHDASVSPDGGWVYICDLGSDSIHHISVPKKDEMKSVQQAGATSVPQGSGPRHLRFHCDKTSGRQFAYLSSELSCTVTAFLHDPDSGNLTMIGQPLLTVPSGVSLGGSLKKGPQRTTAEVAISPDGRFVYVSNRGDPVKDHITVFKRNLDGSLTYLDWFLTGGLMARHFSISQDGKFLAVAHETSGSITILKRDEATGTLSKTDAVYNDLPGTQFAGFYPPQQHV